MEDAKQYIKKIFAEDIAEVINMKMMKTPGKLMLGIGITAAAAVAMTPMVRNMIQNKGNQMTSGSNLDNYSLH